VSDFPDVHAALRAVMLAEAGDLVVARDRPGDLEVRTHALDPRTKQPGWFGTVTTKKSYVAYHLLPLYADPALADGLSAALAKRRQGKTCFNFKALDAALFEELAALTRRARATVG
jgi:hypothetical protein